MQSPDKNPPVLEDGSSDVIALAPQEISQAALKGMETEAAAPTITPEQKAEGFAAVGAAVWNNDKRVNALYTTMHPHNAWMGIVGLGWKKLSVTNDSSCEAMNLLSSHCREKACRIDFAEENGTVKEIYVW